MRLEKWQRNALVKQIVEIKLDLSEFDLDEAEDTD
jgi:hypothetical protein